jgi:hypothetical protein
MTENRYRDVETLRDPDGVVIVITENTSTGRLSYRIQKEFADKGEVRTTAYLGQRHLPAVGRLLAQLPDKLDVITDQIKLARARASSPG